MIAYYYLVNDVFNRGKFIQTVIEKNVMMQILPHPLKIKVATLYISSPLKINEWVIFSYELNDLSEAETRTNKSNVNILFDKI